jgi:hypothetical protein
MEKEKFEQGLAVRRAVLGDDYVDKALADTDDFRLCCKNVERNTKNEASPFCCSV